MKFILSFFLLDFQRVNDQMHKQEFFRADEVPWNGSTSINILSTTIKKNPRRETFWSFFLLDVLKTAYQIRHVTHRWTQSRYFFPKSGDLFSNFQKIAPDDNSCQPVTTCQPCWKHQVLLRGYAQLKKWYWAMWFYFAMTNLLFIID